MDSSDDEKEGKFRQRLWGAAVIIAVMVIVLPLILDGAGSESQFRRVEKLRQEPPMVVDKQGNRSTQLLPEMTPILPEMSIGLPDELLVTETEVDDIERPDYMPAEKNIRETLKQNRTSAPLTAWVIQAGSFRDEENALAIRNSLRRAGFASFVRDRDSENELFRVLVGPMISEQSALAELAEVEKLLERTGLVLTYP